MGGLLRPEFLILVVIALLIFGPKKLPEMGASIGKTIREFQKSMREVKEPEQPSGAVPPAAPTAQISAPATPSTAETQAPAAAPEASTPPAPTAPTTAQPASDTVPPIGTTVE